MENLAHEMGTLTANPAYARSCSAWIGVKCYYLIFYLETILIALLQNDAELLKLSHHEVKKRVCALVKSKALVANKPIFNTTPLNSQIVAHKNRVFVNLQKITPVTERYVGIMRILVRYAMEDYKMKRKIKTLRGEERQKFLAKRTTLIDFFYWYRIKSNYRDLDFLLDMQIPLEDLVLFNQDYFVYTFNTADALIKLINQVYLRSDKTDGRLLIA
jgi:hypothetical protein